MTSKIPKAEYAPRDAAELEPFYSRHVSAMTAEGLHSKSAIAAELAYRDKALTDTQAKLEEATLLLREIKAHWDRGLDLYQSIWDGVVNFLASLEEGKGDK